MTDVHLTMSCGDYDRTRPLIDGRVKPEGIELTTIPLPTPERMFRMLQNGEFDICESSTGMFLAGLEAGRSWVGIPVFPHRRFRHSYFMVSADSGIEKPTDLRGKRVGIAFYTNSAALWVRGFLQHDYGVSPEDIIWVTGGEEEVGEWIGPPGVRIEHAPEGTRLQNMLLSGEIDAMVYPDMVEAFRDGTSKIRRLFPDYVEVEADYYRRTGFFPIMHVMVVRQDVIERYPWVGITMMKTFELAKQVCYDYIRDQRRSSLAFYGAAWEAQQALMGPDPWPYTLERNRPTLEALLQYAQEQGITRRLYGVEELFHPTTHKYDPIFDKQVIQPVIAEGGHVVVMGEEWQTAEAICALNDLLVAAGIRDQAVVLWNANNAFGFHRIDWRRLDGAATVTTVSRFMKQLMWDYGVNPLVIPNGIPRRLLGPVDGPPSSELRRELAAETLLLKVARWDPDKRWLSAMHTVARLKSRGARPVLVARGGVEAHGHEVLDAARSLGLVVRDVHVEVARADDYLHALGNGGPADVINVTSAVPQEVLRVLYRESDAVLANSGREPFGLVGLETMAAGGTAFTGNTGEDYARHLENAVVMETGDPDEAAWYVDYLADRPDEEHRIRQGALETARRFVWERVTENLVGKAELLAARQGALPGRARGRVAAPVCAPVAVAPS